MEVYMKNKKQILTLIIFLLGIFLGAIDSGIVSPARVVIQNGFDISSNLGVWMITIYTLSYAVSMPIVSKLSDTFGRKKVYIISIAIFGIGSALCGLTNFYGSFPLFLAARVIQAIGGGGITPIATAYIGNSFPAEKRGTALGLVGSIYGIATILGPTLGSSILGLAGNNNWGWLFFINVPISIIIIIISFTINEKQEKARAGMDLKGATVVAITILSLMYALTNLNFFKFTQSITALNVWPYLLVFIFSLPLLIYIEGKAKDPILNLKYFTDKQNESHNAYKQFVIRLCGFLT
jgi:MFS family permease